ncbi:AFG1-like ATPase family protein [Aspergillus niger]|uniref:AFG1-like ATPase family protein n=1 Tax=Aspergillus niger TaxID=5061 RepID=A0A505I1Y3_ASPNG|nr:AFG1-like ATPase family protein [Aspergillus niger]
MSASKSQTDIILNKANVALARSQRLVASWLPAPTADDQANSKKTEEELQREEDEIFTAVPETLGVGAPLPTKAADGSWNRSELDSNDKLRKQLLGRNYQKVMAAKKASTAKGGGSDAAASTNPAKNGKAMPAKKRKAAEPQAQSESETIGGESGESKQTSDVGDGSEAKADQSDKQPGASSRPASRRKKATSFLDEILAERSKKRKKR